MNTNTIKEESPPLIPHQAEAQISLAARHFNLTPQEFTHRMLSLGVYLAKPENKDLHLALADESDEVQKDIILF